MSLSAWPRSLEGRLLFRLAIVLVLTLVGGLIASVVAAYRTAAELADEAAADRFVAEFLHDAGWVFPIFAAVVLLVAVWTIRTSLRPLRALSERASAISPGSISVRLSDDRLPSELVPLVVAVNAALDRLAKGFEIQRQFTADAAHELRTPLSILTAGLDALPSSPEIDRLRQDAERMNRLVAQLLRVARLDAQPMDLSQTVDLVEVAEEVVAHLAPWAARNGRSVAFETAERSVTVRGNSDALTDAIRNLVENAITHSPEGEEVMVQVGEQGSVSVIDRGPGVPPDLKERIFERFWRSRERRSSGVGAGLGLSIVSEIAGAHAGRVTVGDTPGGGASFILSVPLASSAGAVASP
jgi:signal transduction histidine kinase